MRGSIVSKRGGADTGVDLAWSTKVVAAHRSVCATARNGCCPVGVVGSSPVDVRLLRRHAQAGSTARSTALHADAADQKASPPGSLTCAAFVTHASTCCPTRPQTPPTSADNISCAIQTTCPSPTASKRGASAPSRAGSGTKYITTVHPAWFFRLCTMHPTTCRALCLQATKKSSFCFPRN